MKPEQVEEKRALILEAALRVFGEKGYHATNIADIARVLRMGHGTFYRYYQNKLDIFRSVISHVVARVSEALIDEGPGEAQDLAAYHAQVERIATRLTTLFSEETRLARLLFVEAVGIDDELTRQLDEAYEVFASMTEAYLRNGQAKGFLREGLDTQTTARAINAMIFEGVRRASASPDPKAAARVWTRSIVTLMFEGVGR